MHARLCVHSEAYSSRVRNNWFVLHVVVHVYIIFDYVRTASMEMLHSMGIVQLLWTRWNTFSNFPTHPHHIHNITLKRSAPPLTHFMNVLWWQRVGIGATRKATMMRMMKTPFAINVDEEHQHQSDQAQNGAQKCGHFHRTCERVKL